MGRVNFCKRVIVSGQQDSLQNRRISEAQSETRYASVERDHDHEARDELYLSVNLTRFAAGKKIISDKCMENLKNGLSFC